MVKHSDYGFDHHWIALKTFIYFYSIYWNFVNTSNIYTTNIEIILDTWNDPNYKTLNINQKL
jgi:hypothetical protein